MTDQRTTGADAGAEAVAAALGRLGQATPADIATAAGIAYSTTNKKLRALREAGRAESFDSPDKRTLWRLTTAAGDAVAAEQPDGGPAAAAAEQPTTATDATITGRPADDTTAVAEPAEDAAAPGEPTDATGDGDGDGSDVPQPAGADGHPLAAPAGTDPDTSTTDADPADRQAAADVHRTDDTADRTEPASDAPCVPDADLGAGNATDPAAADPPRPAKARRASGTLDGAILDILEADPGGQYKVSQLCKLIDNANESTDAAKASPGAVVLAAQRLVRKDKAVLAVERPATFQLARPTD